MPKVRGPIPSGHRQHERSLSSRCRGHPRGISLTTAAIGVFAPLIFGLMFLSIMSGWAEHPHGWERVGQAVGAVVVVPFGCIYSCSRFHECESLAC